MISIVIATYNAESTLQRCLESIIYQLSNDVELIIIDGGSADKTLDIINKYKKYISYFISEKDKGVYDAWNKAIKVAKGDWLMFVGADDILFPNSIHHYVQLLKQEDLSTYDYICGINEYINAKDILMKNLVSKPSWDYMKKGMSVAHVGSLHNKQNLFGMIGEYNLKYKIGADYELLIRKREKLKVYFLPQKIARMQTNGMSFSVSAIKESFLIRKQHLTVNILYNFILFARDWFAFKLFILRKPCR